MIPYGRQEIIQADIDAVVAVLRSDFLTQGPTVPAFENAVFSLKSNLQGKITKRFNYMASFDYYYINSNQFSNFIETSIIGVFAKSTRFKFCLGPKLVYGQYPFGNQINILPYFNIIFNVSIKSKKTW